MSDLLDKWTNEESPMGDIFEVDGNEFEIVPITDSNKDGLARIVVSQYVGFECPYCKRPMSDEDLHNAIGSIRYVHISVLQPIHPECYEKYEKPEMERVAAALAFVGQRNDDVFTRRDFIGDEIVTVWGYTNNAGKDVMLSHDTHAAIEMILNTAN